MPERPDLAATTSRLSRALVRAEGPILAEHGLTMWAYVILSSLASEPPVHPGAARVGLPEAIEDERQELGRDAIARVLDQDLDLVSRALELDVDALGIRHSQDRIALAAEIHALINRRQKARAPERRSA